MYYSCCFRCSVVAFDVVVGCGGVFFVYYLLLVRLLLSILSYLDYIYIQHIKLNVKITGPVLFLSTAELVKPL